MKSGAQSLRVLRYAFPQAQLITKSSNMTISKSTYCSIIYYFS